MANGRQQLIARRHRTCKSKALPNFATELCEHLMLLVGFNTFGHRGHAEFVGQRDNRTNQLLGRFVVVEPLDEGSIDLEGVEGKVSEIRERGVASSEVVKE